MIRTVIVGKVSLGKTALMKWQLKQLAKNHKRIQIMDTKKQGGKNEYR